MLYLIDLDIETLRCAQGDKRESLLAEEWKRSRELYDTGIMLRIWRKANARGVVAVWNCTSHDELQDNIVNMPLYPYFTNIEITPLLPHPRFPQFAEAERGQKSDEEAKRP